jgi:hypothetical protein
VYVNLYGRFNVHIKSKVRSGQVIM